MNIIKGTNEPIVLEFEMDIEAEKISALLYSTFCEKTLKHWDKEDMEIDGKTIKLPMREDETLDFQVGVCVLEMKLLDENNNIVFFDSVKGNVINKRDGTKLTE